MHLIHSNNTRIITKHCTRCHATEAIYLVTFTRQWRLCTQVHKYLIQGRVREAPQRRFQQREKWHWPWVIRKFLWPREHVWQMFWKDVVREVEKEKVVQFIWGVIFLKKVMGSKVLYLYSHPTSLSLGLVPPLVIGNSSWGEFGKKPQVREWAVRSPPVLPSVFSPLQGILFRPESSSPSLTGQSSLLTGLSIRQLFPSLCFLCSSPIQTPWATTTIYTLPQGPHLPWADILLLGHITGCWWYRAS